MEFERLSPAVESIRMPNDAKSRVAAALAESKVQKQAEGKELVKKIVVRGKDGNIKLVNLIFRPAR